MMMFFIAEPAAVVDESTFRREQTLMVSQARQESGVKIPRSAKGGYSDSELNTAAQMLAKLRQPQQEAGYDADRTLDVVVEKLLEVLG